MKHIFLKGLVASASLFVLLFSSVSAGTCTNLTKGLVKGTENAEVLSLQQFLFDGGYLAAKPNGYFGNGTLLAVKKFQKANGLAQVGSVGPGTRGKVKEVSCGSQNQTIKTTVKDYGCDSYKSCVVKNLLTCTKFATSTQEKINDHSNGVTKTFTVNLDTKILGEVEGRCSVESFMSVTALDSPKKISTVSSCSVNVASLKKNTTGTLDNDAVLTPLSQLPAVYDIQQYLKGAITKEEIQTRLTEFSTSNHSITDTRYFSNCTGTFSVNETGNTSYIASVSSSEQQIIDSRNLQRKNDVNTILNAVNQYMIDHNGYAPYSGAKTSTEICSTKSTYCVGLINLEALTSSSGYLVAIPRDPQVIEDNKTGYLVSISSAGRVTVTASLAEGVVISVTR